MAHHDRISRTTQRAMAADPDLVWLFNQSDAEVSGLRASHGALVEMAQTGAARAGAGTGGIPRRVQGITARQADAVDRQRGLRARLAQLSAPHQEVLWLAYGPRPWMLAADERQRLGQWYGVTLVTQTAARGWAQEERQRAKKERERLAKVVVEPSEDEAGEQVPERDVEPVACWFAKGLGHWLRGPAVDGALLSAVRAEAEKLVGEAYSAWRDTRAAKDKRRPDWGAEERGRERLRTSKASGGDEELESGDRISETRIIRYQPEPMPRARAAFGRGGL